MERMEVQMTSLFLWTSEMILKNCIVYMYEQCLNAKLHASTVKATEIPRHHSEASN